ncbi:hypothetical protein BJ878DRAFT_513493 [Calycina marina]|uniref:Uncharacterized protein n=1 Tax=Calycina marina TaxID=1763456 RepID=A0A9P7YZJ0_9HELO|nr:hypothetical protein BJ878DRAFT_513493 [Calycina marina]
MSLATHSSYYPSTTNRSQKRHEHSTITKIRFYDALDPSGGSKSFHGIASERAPSLRTAARWKEQRALLGSPSYRWTSKLSNRLGRNSKVSKSACQMLHRIQSANKLSARGWRAPRNLPAVTLEFYFHDIDCSIRTIQRSLTEHTNGGQEYKQAYVEKVISRANKDN